MLRPRVFLDTEVFDSNHYNFNSRDLKQLKALAENLSVELLLTDVVVYEVHKHLRRRASELANDAQKLCKKFNNVDPEGVGAELQKESYSAEHVYNLLEKNFEDFLDSCHAEVISVEDVSSREVFSLYFQEQSPFSIMGKKKNEFPDAFTLLALRDFSRERNVEISVVSNDGDPVGFCAQEENLIHYSSLREFYEKSLESIGYTMEFYNDLVLKRWNDLEAYIIDNIPNHCSFQASHSIYDILQAECIDLSYGDHSLISIDEPYIDVSIDVTAKFSVEYSEIDRIFEAETAVDLNLSLSFCVKDNSCIDFLDPIEFGNLGIITFDLR
ncbi:PIN domain-containing protein [Marinomonas sp. FW-1]|uniref:PIN domain-containing protein n=1 Tax=Marinomonas sp. FW-1 TaxID=2071621 RepID=UPI0010BF925D|nr:PIN domain-containing protein [Marinomonas sp. FW-1]